MSVTVVTATIPERGEMLAACVAGFAAQTVQPDAHLIGVDYAHDGPFSIYPPLTDLATTNWVCHFSDDDYPFPDHLERMIDETVRDPQVDIVGTWCRAVGFNFRNYNQEFDPAVLMAGRLNVSATALFRKSLWDEIGGWDYVDGGGRRCYSDLDFFRRALIAGAKITVLPVVTFEYRFHGQNLSRGQLAGVNS